MTYKLSFNNSFKVIRPTPTQNNQINQNWISPGPAFITQVQIWPTSWGAILLGLPLNKMYSCKPTEKTEVGLILIYWEPVPIRTPISLTHCLNWWHLLVHSCLQWRMSSVPHQCEKLTHVCMRSQPLKQRQREIFKVFRQICIFHAGWWKLHHTTESFRTGTKNIMWRALSTFYFSTIYSQISVSKHITPIWQILLFCLWTKWDIKMC